MRKRGQILTDEKLRSLDDIPFEQWGKHGVELSAVSANHARVFSGITRCGCYFIRVYKLVDGHADPNDRGQLTILERGV